MKAIAVVFGLLAAVLAAIGISGPTQQLFTAGVVGILALAFWRA